ncbi:MAG: CdaR family protein [Thermoanaerobaculia bacterium]
MSDSMNRWGLRLLAVTLALVAWFAFSVEKRELLSDKVFEATVRYENYPGLVILERVESVRIGVRGPVSKVRSLNPLQIDVFVEVPEPAKGVFEVPLSAENVFLPEDLEVVSIEPNVIPIELDRQVDHLLGVRARLEGEAAAGAVVMEPEILPPMVLVRGPQSKIDEAGVLTTTPIDLTGHALDFETQARVVSPDPLISVVQPAFVTVRIPLEIPGTGNGEPETPPPD